MSVTQLRKPTLGGSTAAAAAGVDPYRSRVMLWAEMTGRVKREPTEAMEWGNRLEPVVMAALADRGHKVEAPADADDATWTDPAREWLVGHVDGYVKPDTLLEVKTASAYTRHDAPPLAYVAQVQTYLHLTGLDRALLAMLVGGQKLLTFNVERDDDAIGILLGLMEDFYGYVVRDEPPPPDGSSSAKDALLALYPEPEKGSVVRADRELRAVVRDLKARRAQHDAIGEQVTELENRVKAFMGDAETLISEADVPLVKWSASHTTRLDTTRLRKDAPHVYTQYAVTSTTRRFTVS